MKCDGRDNTKKLWSFNSTVVSLKKCMSGYFFLYDTFIVGICNSNHSDNDDNESNKYKIIIMLTTVAVILITIFLFIRRP